MWNYEKHVEYFCGKKMTRMSFRKMKVIKPNINKYSGSGGQSICNKEKA